MAKPDLQFGPGDTRPKYRLTIFDPAALDGSPGNATDLTGKTCAFGYQPRDGSAIEVERPLTIIQSSPTVDRGVVELDLLATGGAIPNIATDGPTDYKLRVFLRDGSGGQETFPHGEDVDRLDGTNPAFLWLQVARPNATP